MPKILSTVNYMTKHNFPVIRYNYKDYSKYFLNIDLIDESTLTIVAKYVEHCLNVQIYFSKYNKWLTLDKYDAYIDPIGLFNNMDILIHMLDPKDQKSVDNIILRYDTGCNNHTFTKNSVIFLQHIRTYETDFYEYKLMKEDEHNGNRMFNKVLCPIHWKMIPDLSGYDEDIINKIFDGNTTNE